MDFHHQLVTYLRDLKYKMKIKFCGIKNIDDLKFIIEKNINYAGFIFYKKSKRFVDDKLLKEIKNIDFKRTVPVCVFVNGKKDYIESICSNFKNPIIQFHGDESEDFCESFNYKYWKALRVEDEEVFSFFDKYKNAEAILLENYKPGHYGGTGESFDWSILKKNKTNKNIILSGGINLENINNAITMSPWCIDINSGAEDVNGNKDKDLIISFLKIVNDK